MIGKIKQFFFELNELRKMYDHPSNTGLN